MKQETGNVLFHLVPVISVNFYGFDCLLLLPRRLKYVSACARASLGIHLVDVTHSLLCPARCHRAALAQRQPDREIQRAWINGSRHVYFLKLYGGVPSWTSEKAAVQTPNLAQPCDQQDTFQLSRRSKAHFCSEAVKLLSCRGNLSSVLSDCWEAGTCLPTCLSGSRLSLLWRGLWLMFGAFEVQPSVDICSSAAVVGLVSGVGNENELLSRNVSPLACCTYISLSFRACRSMYQPSTCPYLIVRETAFKNTERLDFSLSIFRIQLCIPVH